MLSAIGKEPPPGQQAPNEVVPGQVLRGLDQAQETIMMVIFTEFGMEHIDYDAYDDWSKEESDMRIWKDEWEWLASPAFATIREILGRIPIGKTALIRKNDRNQAVYGGVTPEELNEFKSVVICDLLYDVVCVKAMKKNGLAGPFLPAELSCMLTFGISWRTPSPTPSNRCNRRRKPWGKDCPSRSNGPLVQDMSSAGPKLIASGCTMSCSSRMLTGTLERGAAA